MQAGRASIAANAFVLRIVWHQPSVRARATQKPGFVCVNPVTQESSVKYVSCKIVCVCTPNLDSNTTQKRCVTVRVVCIDLFNWKTVFANILYGELCSKSLYLIYPKRGFGAVCIDFICIGFPWQQNKNIHCFKSEQGPFTASFSTQIQTTVWSCAQGIPKHCGWGVYAQCGITQETKVMEKACSFSVWLRNPTRIDAWSILMLVVSNFLDQYARVFWK